MRRGELGKGLDAGGREPAAHPGRAHERPHAERGELDRVPIPGGPKRRRQLFRPLALAHLWRNAAGLTWQPLGMLNLSGDLVSTRDLRIYPDSSPLGRLAYSERRFLLGIPVGVERDRSVTTALQLTPKLASWLRPRLISSSSFVLSRTLSSRDPVRADGDSGAFILPQTLNNARTNELGAAIDFARGLRFLVGDSSGLGKATGARASDRREHPAHPHLHLRSHRVRPQPEVSACPRRTRELPGAGGRGRARRVRHAHGHGGERRRPALWRVLHPVARAHPDHAAAARRRGIRGDRDPISASGRSATSAGAAPSAAGPSRSLRVGTAFRHREGTLRPGQSGRAAGAHQHHVVVRSRRTSNSASGTGSP